jgi:DNA-binding transcriptional regulator YiaG
MELFMLKNTVKEVVDLELEKDMAEAFGRIKGRKPKISRFETTRYALPPDPGEVKALRNSLGLSQPKFAGLVNVSLRSVQAWEQGQRRPDGAATALFFLLKKHKQVADWLTQKHLTESSKAR